MILDDLAEKSRKEVVIHDVDPLALTLLVDFAYTGEIVVTEENVQVTQMGLFLLCFTFFFRSLKSYIYIFFFFCEEGLLSA